MSGELKIPSVAILLLLYSCSAQRFVSERFDSLALLPPAEGATEVLLKQKITIQTREKQQQFLTVARFEKHQLKLVVLSSSGQQLLLLDYDGEALIQKTLSPALDSGEEILAIMQFSMWPLQSIKRHYSEQRGWLVEVTPAKRTLSTATGLALKIDYQGNKILVDNYLRDYRVIVDTLEEIKL